MNEDLLLSTLQSISARLQGIEKAQKDTQRVAVKTAEDVSELRLRLLEEADRTGGQVKKHVGEIIAIEARLTKVERATRVRPVGAGNGHT